MSIRYAEDFEEGDIFDIGHYEVTREEIIKFAKKYDPFPFHVDEEFGSELKLILDGGPCPLGLESTVVDLTTMCPYFLDPAA